MPVLPIDLPRGLGAPLGKITANNLATTGVKTIYTFPPTNYGSAKSVLCAVAFDNFSAGATAATLNIGQSTTATQNDFVSGQSVGANLIVWIPTSTSISFSPSTIIQINITGGGAGTCDITLYGWVQ